MHFGTDFGECWCSQWSALSHARCHRPDLGRDHWYRFPYKGSNELLRLVYVGDWWLLAAKFIEAEAGCHVNVERVGGMAVHGDADRLVA